MSSFCFTSSVTDIVVISLTVNVAIIRYIVLIYKIRCRITYAQTNDRKFAKMTKKECSKTLTNEMVFKQ